MQWKVTYRYEHVDCCPPGRGWVVKTCTVHADTELQARAEFFRIWPPRRRTEIKDIKPIDKEHLNDL